MRSNQFALVASSSLAIALMSLEVAQAEAAPKPPANAAAPKDGAVPFTDLKMNSAFQSFVGNWDDQRQPVLCAILTDSKQWDQVVHPAPVMGSRKPYGPEAAFYGKSMILLVSRVVPALGGLKAGTVTLGGGTLTFAYTYTPRSRAGSGTYKDALAIAIPSGTKFDTAVFTENGREAGRLNAAKGKWCLPATASK